MKMFISLIQTQTPFSFWTIESIPEQLSWLQKLSFFNFAFEALLVNEITFLQLIQKEYGLEIDVSFYCCFALCCLLSFSQ